MKKSAVVITDSEELSEALCKYVEYLLNMECSYFTYSNSDLMSGEIYARADIFLLELTRLYSGWHIRAEGIFVAEKLLKNGKKVLIVAAEVNCDRINSPIYWDIACQQTLKEKIEEALAAEYDPEAEIAKLKEVYKDYLSAPSHHHHHR